MSLKKTLLFIFTILLLLIPKGYTAENDEVVKSQEFHDTLTRFFSLRLYWNCYDFTNSNWEYDPNADGYKIYPKLGHKIHGKVFKVKDGYIIEFPDDLPAGLQTFFISQHNTKQGQFGINDINNYQDNSVIITDKYEFTIPENFNEIASKFGEGSEEIIIKMEKALTRLIRQYKASPKGLNHFYVAPFNKDIPSVYWIELKSELIQHPLNSERDLSERGFVDFKFLSFDFPEKCYPTENKLEFEKHKIFVRYNHSSRKISNYVRDGKLIVIENK